MFAPAPYDLAAKAVGEVLGHFVDLLKSGVGHPLHRFISEKDVEEMRMQSSNGSVTILEVQAIEVKNEAEDRGEKKVEEPIPGQAEQKSKGWFLSSICGSKNSKSGPVNRNVRIIKKTK